MWSVNFWVSEYGAKQPLIAYYVLRSYFASQNASESVGQNILIVGDRDHFSLASRAVIMIEKNWKSWSWNKL